MVCAVPKAAPPAALWDGMEGAGLDDVPRVDRTKNVGRTGRRKRRRMRGGKGGRA